MEETEYLVESKLAGHWWFSGRRRLLEVLVADLAKNKPGGRFEKALDIGCGVGLNADALRPHVKLLVGMDMEELAIEHSKKQPYDVLTLGTLEDLTAEKLNGKADLVIAMDILEHLQNDEIGTRSVREVLTDDGLAIFTVPANQWLWSMQDEVGHHFRRYSKKKLKTLLESQGFEILRLTYFNAWLFLPIVAMRLAMRLWRPKNLVSENQINTQGLNWVLTKIFQMDVDLVAKGFNYPFGISLLAVVRKNSL